jgi:universal stress protein A
MSTPRNILVATDFGEASQEALKYAFEIATAHDAKVHLVHVVPPESRNSDVAPPEPLLDPDTWAEHELDRLAEPYRASGHLGECHAPVGDPTTEILRDAERLGVDLIVVGANEHTRLNRLLRSSVAGHIFRRASCPVAILRGSTSHGVS